jgi:hypothetical protein
MLRKLVKHFPSSSSSTTIFSAPFMSRPHVSRSISGGAEGLLRNRDYMSTTLCKRGGVALVRRPSPKLVDGIVTHIEKSPIDLDLATKQWNAYCNTLRRFNWKIIEVPPAPLCPDGVFIEDTVVMCKNLAIGKLLNE